MDKIVDAINDFLGDDGKPEEKPNASDPGASQRPDTPDRAPHDGAKGRNLDQLVSDAKQQLGDKPQ